MSDPLTPDQPLPNTTPMPTGGNLWQPPSVEEAAQLFPQYEVLALLGRGGMGAVYQARQLALDRLVAIKLLPLEVSADPSFADRFVREARTMGKLSHPNIIAVYDFGQTSAGHLYFAMEFVEGTNLHQIIHGPGLKPVQALSIIGEVCDALAYAHGKGVVHRDIKPANVMVNTEGRVKVADFGLARLTDPSAEQFGHTQTGFVMGTPDYMAPEQTRGMNVDHRADIYSLGVMLYEMLCGEVPRGIFDPPSHRVPVDARLDQVVVKAMQQVPDRRFQSSTEMKVALDTIRAQPAPKRQPSAASAPAQSGEPQPRVEKSRSMLFVGIAAAVVAGIGIASWWIAAQKRGGSSGRTAAGQGRVSIPPSTPAAPASPQPSPGARSMVQTEPTATEVPVVPKAPLAPRKAAPLEEGAVPLWATLESIPSVLRTEANDGVIAFRGSGYPSRGATHRDGTLRAALVLGPGSDPGLSVRTRFLNGSSDRYRLQFHPAENRVAVYLDQSGVTTELKSWPLPRRFGPMEWVEVEFRAVGEELSVVLDRQLVGTIRDSSLTNAGGFFVFAKPGCYMFDVVFAPAKPATAHSVSAPTTPASPAMPSAAAADSPKPTDSAPTSAAATPAPVAALSVTAKWLAEQVPQWEAAFASEVTAPFEKAVNDLRKQYLAAVEGLLATATRTGKLDEAVILRADRDLVGASGEVPAEDEAAAPAALRTLRANYRTTFARLDADRFTKAKAFHARYDAVLGQSQTALTQRQRLDEALELKTKREALTAAWLKPPASAARTATTPAPGRPTLKSATASPTPARKKGTPTAAERRAALEWIFSRGGHARVGIDGKEITVKTTGELPSGPYVVSLLNIQQGRTMPTAEEVQILTALHETNYLFFDGWNVPNETFAFLREFEGVGNLAFRRCAEITDGLFDYLPALPKLTSLTIEFCPNVTGIGMAKLKAPILNTVRFYQGATDAGLAALGKFETITKFTLRDAPITDAGMVHLHRLRQLEDLSLIQTAITPAALEFLKTRKTFKALEYEFGSDADALPKVQALVKILPNLRTLRSYGKLTAEQVRALAGFKDLVELRAGMEGDAAFAEVAGLTKLETLICQASGLTDASFDAIVGLKELVSLDLRSNRELTDAGLMKLKSLKKLRYFSCPGTKITQAGGAALLKERPGVGITY